MPKMTFPAAGGFAFVLAFCCFAIASFSQEQKNAISGDDVDKLLVTRVEPVWPESVKAANIAGDIFVRFDILKNGRTADVHAFYANGLIGNFATTDHPEVQKAALDAVRQWKFRPYLRDGKRAEVSSITTVHFDFCKDLSCHREGPAGKIRIARASDADVLPSNAKVSVGELSGRKIKDVLPQYPQMAKIAHVQGEVVLDVVIDTTGHIVQMKPVSGHPLLIASAMDAVKQWEYEPFRLNGKVVEVETQITVKFHMGP